MLKTSNLTLKKKQDCTPWAGNPRNVLLTCRIRLKYFYQCTFHFLNKLFYDLKKICKFNRFSRSPQQFLLTVGQNNFDNKIPFFRVVKPHLQDLSEFFCCCWFRKTWMADVILLFSFFWLSWINKELTVTELYVFFLPHETRTDKQNILMHSGQLTNVIKTCIALVLFELSWTLFTNVDHGGSDSTVIKRR